MFDITDPYHFSIWNNLMSGAQWQGYCRLWKIPRFCFYLIEGQSKQLHFADLVPGLDCLLSHASWKASGLSKLKIVCLSFKKYMSFFQTRALTMSFNQTYRIGRRPRPHWDWQCFISCTCADRSHDRVHTQSLRYSRTRRSRRPKSPFRGWLPCLILRRAVTVYMHYRPLFITRRVDLCV